MTRWAIAVTCHNRKDKTLACLAALFDCRWPADASYTVFLVDDGSSDGTAQAVKTGYPSVNILSGDGSLFWNGGMHMALAAAMAEGFDQYLWLNDDTTLVPEAIMMLWTTLETIRSRTGDDCIIVGSVRDHSTEAPTYGGVRRPSWWKRSTFVLVRPAAEPVWCETMNGNCVLIPRAVAEKVGNLDSEFAHGLGDYDYGLRARAAGVQAWIAPGFVGYCSRDSRLRAFAPETSLSERLRVMTSRKGLPPRAWARFTRRHCGMLWLIFWAYPYCRTVTDSCMSALLGRRKSANA